MRRVSASCWLPVWLSGCSNYHTTGPEAWWHDAIGGKIAAGAAAAAGRQGSVSEPGHRARQSRRRPIRAAWNRMTAGLLTDRIKADETAALAPIPPPASGALRRRSPRRPPARRDAGQDGGASAALVAPRRRRPRRRQRNAAQSPRTAKHRRARCRRRRAPGADGGSPIYRASARAGRGRPPISRHDRASRLAWRHGGPANGSIPPLPTQEPARPDIAPGAAPPLVPITAAPPHARRRRQRGTGDRLLPRLGRRSTIRALTEVKALAAARGERGIAVTGYGDATSSDAAGAVGRARPRRCAARRPWRPRWWRRACRMRCLRLNAESAGRGASLRLLQ